ncbi:MAG: DsrE/DsrF/TusD sulfur relay family protein [Candidatus Lokiarchaeia archaeon]
MEKITVVISSGPYTHERAYTALRLALTALVEGLKVNLFLIEDGIFVAHKGQNPKAHSNNLEWLQNVLDEGGKLRVCGVCCTARGITQEELIDGAEIATMESLVEWMKESDQTIWI